MCTEKGYDYCIAEVKLNFLELTSPCDYAANHSECKLIYTLYLSQMIASLYRFTNDEDNRLTERT